MDEGARVVVVTLLPLPDLPGLKFATPRDDAYPTIGGRQAEFSRIWLRQPFMPWQEFAADVMGEYDPETGIPRRSLWVVTLMRQVGKTHLCMAQTGERCFCIPNFRAWYTAQSGKDARSQFLKFNDVTLHNTPLGRVVHTLRGNGGELMRFPNLSQLRPHPPTEEAMHGEQSDQSDVDEAWAHSKEEGKALMQGITPTQLTRPMAQTRIWSAGGTAASTWLAELVARGRAGDPTIGYLEFGIPDELPLDDPYAIAAHNPAYGHTITVESIRKLRAAFEDDDAGYARAAGNRWTEVIGGAIPMGAWTKLEYGQPIPDDAPLAFGAARAEDGSHVVIVAAARIDSKIIGEVIDVMPAHNAAPRVKALAAGSDLALDPSGPSAPLVSELVRLRTGRLRQLSARDASAAVGLLLDSVTPGAYLHRPNPTLDAAVRVAAKRSIGDGGYAWSRSSAGASIAALEAFTWATYALTNRRAGKPTIRA